jgi:NAD(P)H-hydrate epimerase
MPKRRPDGHKGVYGHVLVVGGSRGMVGAVALAANAALRGGAGLATFAAPETVQLTIAALCPCATLVPLACDQAGELAAQSVRQMLHESAYDVLAVGPGMGKGAGQRNLVRTALTQEKPLVIDADGLNNLASIDDWPATRRCPMVLTPHPGEFGRLIGRSTKEVQADRAGLAINAAKRWASQGAGDKPLVLVLKGQGTIVTDGQRVFTNTTGNPGMATGGTGDVLTGLTAAIVGQGLEPFDAAVLAVHIHGLAGDLAAKKLGQISMIASDLLEFIPQAFKQHAGT